MELFNNLALGFGVAFTFQNLIYAFVGCLLGTLIGVLPGVGPVATIAMLLPATYALPPVAALIMLAGIYYGAQYGGSTTAILVNLPGEASSVVTMIDGYQMARKGRAGPALAAAGLGSFFAGCVGTLILAAFAAPLTEVAFKFGPAEYFSLMVLGLIGAVVANIDTEGVATAGMVQPAKNTDAPAPAQAAAAASSRSRSTAARQWDGKSTRSPRGSRRGAAWGLRSRSSRRSATRFITSSSATTRPARCGRRPTTWC